MPLIDEGFKVYLDKAGNVEDILTATAISSRAYFIVSVNNKYREDIFSAVKRLKSPPFVYVQRFEYLHSKIVDDMQLSQYETPDFSGAVLRVAPDKEMDVELIKDVVKESFPTVKGFSFIIQETGMRSLRNIVSGLSFSFKSEEYEKWYWEMFEMEARLPFWATVFGSYKERDGQVKCQIVFVHDDGYFIDEKMRRIEVYMRERL